jgi:glycosyltransferase involved in cell wall biosynthesis
MGRLFDQAVSFANDWRQPYPDINLSASVSIVVPLHRPYHLREFLAHTTTVAAGAEVVLVDDSGSNIENVPSSVGTEYPVTVVQHAKNLGRSAARNTGAAYASGDILIFLDQDMFLSPGFLYEVRASLAANDARGLVLGMRTTKPLSAIPPPHRWQALDPDVDWRHRVIVTSDLIDVTASGVGSVHNRCRPEDPVRLHDETRGFRDLGIAVTSTIGYWDLASVVVSHSLAITREDFWRLGGFPEWIRGWGGEDTVLGFCAVTAGVPIIPGLSVSYQAQHPPYSGSDEAKFAELAGNMRRYRDWAQTADALPRANRAARRERGLRVR